MKTRPLTYLILVLLLSSYLKASEIFNYGEYWLSISSRERARYVKGVSDGVAHAYFAAANSWLSKDEIFNSPPTARVEEVRKKVFLMLEVSAISEVMTDLYKDPSNAFIIERTMLFLARDKLLGEKIEDALIKARKSAIADHEIIRYIKK